MLAGGLQTDVVGSQQRVQNNDVVSLRAVEGQVEEEADQVPGCTACSYGGPVPPPRTVEVTEIYFLGGGRLGHHRPQPTKSIFGLTGPDGRCPINQLHGPATSEGPPICFASQGWHKKKLGRHLIYQNERTHRIEPRKGTVCFQKPLLIYFKMLPSQKTILQGATRLVSKKKANKNTLFCFFCQGMKYTKFHY